MGVVSHNTMLRGLGFHMKIKKDIFENLFVPNCNS